MSESQKEISPTKEAIPIDQALIENVFDQTPIEDDTALEKVTGKSGTGVKPKRRAPYDYVHSYIPSLKLRRNLVTKKVEHENLEDVDDVKINSYYLDIKEKCNGVSKGLVLDYLLSNRLEEYHPFLEYFESIPSIKSSEATNKLFSSLNVNFKDDSEETICKNIFIKWMLQFFASAYHTGPLDIMMIFTGEMNNGKTYFFENLLPKELSKYISTIKDFPKKEEDAKMMMCYSLLLLRDDITGTGGKDKDWIKSILSNTELSFRAPYGKSIAKYRRYAVLCATSNDRGVITSEEKANRRIFPMRVDSRDQDKFDEILNDGIDIIWGELKYLWNQAPKKRDLYRVTKKEIEYLSALNEFREVDELEEAITKYFIEDSDSGVTATDISITLKQQTMKNYSTVKIGKYLNSAGIKGKRTSRGGVAGTYYSLKLIIDPYRDKRIDEFDSSQSDTSPTQSDSG